LFFKEGQYRILVPPVKAGDTLASVDSDMQAKAEPPLEIGEAPANCLIKITKVPSMLNAGIKVKDAFLGLMRGGEILIAPVVAVEAPVSPQDKLEELAESLDSIMHELRTEKDMLGVRRYVNSFVYAMRIIEQRGKPGEPMDTQQKIEWMNQNHFIYNLFNYTPQEGFSNISSVVEKYGMALKGRIQVNEYWEPFYTAWDLCVAQLNAMGIKETAIVPYKTRVAKKELLDGWTKENTENRAADENHVADMVYGIIKKGVEIDGRLIQKPVVNVYA
jgi:hypothetical protein